MGLFDFIKEAGEKVLGGGKAQAQPVPQPNPAEAKPEVDRQLAYELVKFVEKLGLEVEDLGIKVIDGTATVTGRVPSQSAREKLVLAVGNVAGVGRVDDNLVVAVQEPPAVFYTVQRGDTLSKIAKEHYGSANKYPLIFEANKPMLKDPDKIYPGQVLRIPPLAEAK